MLWQVFSYRESDFRSVAWSPDGRGIAAGATDGCIWIFDGDQVRLCEGHTGTVNAVAFSQNGQYLVSGSVDATVRLWDAVSLKEIRALRGHSGSVSGVAFNLSGNRIASSSLDYSVRLWDVDSNDALREWREGDPNWTSWVNCVAFHPDGMRLASGHGDGMIRLWSIEKDDGRISGEHTLPLRSLSFSPDGKRLLSGAMDYTARLWDVESGTKLGEWSGHEEDVTSVSFRPDGKIAATASHDTTVRIWDAKKGTELRRCEGHTERVNGIAFSPDGMQVVSASSDGTVRLWEAATSKPLRQYTGHKPDGAAANVTSYEACWTSRDNRIHLWDARTAQPAGDYKGSQGAVTSVAANDDGTMLAAAQQNSIFVWFMKRAFTVTLRNKTREALSLALSSSGAHLVSGSSDKSVRLWNLLQGEEERVCEGHTEHVRSVAFSPDDKMVASGSNDNTVRIWDVARGRTRQVLRGHTAPVVQLHWAASEPFLISSDERGACIVWRCSDWSIVGQSGAGTYRHVCVGIVEGDMAPKVPDWLVVYPLTLSEPTPDNANLMRFRCARVVLIGDGGVGKTSIAHRLLHGHHIQHGRTHGLKIWRIPAGTLHEKAPKDYGEIYLWDLGGQPAYRILHQLFFPDTRLGVFVFIPRDTSDLDRVEDWNACLEAQTKGAKKLLVRTHIDREQQADPAPRIDQMMSGLGFLQPYYRVSSETGDGFEELRKAIYENLEWTSVTELAIFTRIREMVEAAWQAKRAAINCSELRERAERELSATDAQFEEALNIVRAEGMAVEIKLPSGGRVLVNPEPLERYAGSIILEAKREDKPAPVVEYRWVQTTSAFPEIKQEERLSPTEEQLVLTCAIELMIERRLCQWVQGMLVFPQLFSDRGLGGNSPEESIRTEFAYEFAGPIQHVYATIAVGLAISKTFGDVWYWADRAEYRSDNGEYFGFRVQQDDRRRFGRGRFELYFSPNSSPARRQLFYATIVKQLADHGVKPEEQQKLICPTEGEIPTKNIEAWQRLGLEEVDCPLCFAHRVRLWNPSGALQEQKKGVANVETRIASGTKENISAVQEQSGRFEAAQAKKPVRILHLTDLHFGVGQTVPAQAQPLLSDLEKRGGAQVDFLVVSGDFADKCKPEGFQVAKSFLDFLIKEGLVASPARVILVPGNHDQLRDRSIFVEMDDAQHGEWSRKTELGYYVRTPEYMGRFRYFYDLFKDLTQGDYPHDASKQCGIHTFEEEGIQFLTLNSAWQTDRLQEKIGSLHPDAVALAARRVNKKCLPIAVWHHAPYEWEDEAKNKVVYRLEEESLLNLANSGIRIVLHGHVHERRSEAVNVYYNAKDRMHMMGGGAFGTEKKDRLPGTPRMYNLIEVATDHSSFTITTRCRGEGNSHFKPYAVWPIPGNEDNLSATLRVDLA